MKLFLSIIYFLLLFTSCEKKRKVTVQTPCNCNLSESDMQNKYPISPLNDSVVLCKTGLVNGMNWLEYLQNNIFYDDIEIFNCNTNENILTKYSDISITYKNKSLIAYSKKNVPFFDPVLKRWNAIVVNVYKEAIYSEKGKIKKSKAEIILTPLKYTQLTIEEVNKEYQRKIKTPHSVYIIQKLLGAALSGDSLSRERLIHLKSQFPDDTELKFLDESIEILNDFDKLCSVTRETIYLDNSLYAILKNYR